MLNPEAHNRLGFREGTSFRLDQTPFHRAQMKMSQDRFYDGSLRHYVDLSPTQETMQSAINQVVVNINESVASADPNISELAIKLATYQFYSRAIGAQAEQQVHRRIAEHLPNIAFS